MFTTDGWIAILVTLAILVVVQVRKRVPIDLLFVGGLIVVTLTGVITPEQAIRGFANEAVLTIGGLLVVSSALRSTGVLDWVGQRLLGSVTTAQGAIVRLAVTLVSSSALILNTPLVAMMVPVVVDWCRRRSVSPSRVLIPVSYLVILGGFCSLIGTSTTLIVNGMLREQYRAQAAQVTAAATVEELQFVESLRPMGLFEIGKVGVPCAVVGALVLVALNRWLLPDRQEMIESLDEHRREYLVEMLVQPGCRLIGQKVETAGLRSLPGLFLIEIDRSGDVITPVTPSDTIQSHDRLVFTGIVNTIVDLESIPGLIPAADHTYEFHSAKAPKRYLTEVVLSRTSPLIGRTLKQANFRKLYNAAVVAVHRNGERISTKLGNVVLVPGDTLLLQTRNEFVSRYRNSRDFYLVSGVDGYTPRYHDRAWLSAALGLILILWLSLSGWFREVPALAGLGSPAVAAITVAMLMVGTRCLPIADARSALDLQILLTIVGALGLGQALWSSGAAATIAHGLVEAVGHRPYLTLAIVYLLGLLFTELITNNAVATILLPLAISVAREGHYDPRPFVMAIALSASLSFITPVGYQTNLMVMSPGGYRPSDYLRAGIPVAAVVTLTALLLIPRVWPLY